MHDQGGRPVKVDQRRIAEHGEAGAAGKFFTDQKVAVAVQEEDGSAMARQGRQCVGDIPIEGIIEVVVAGPVFEQIAEDV